MANQIMKKELLEETLHHHPEGSEEDQVDKEWEEFTRLMAKLKETRRNRPHRYIRASHFFFLATEKLSINFEKKKLNTSAFKLKEKKFILLFMGICSTL